MLIESNITNDERQYRNFCGIVKSYRPDVSIDDIHVCKTSKGNWLVHDKDCKKICLISKNILNDELVDSKKIKRCDC